MKTSNHTDKIFESKLKDHAPSPPSHLWDRLEAALPETPKQKRRAIWPYYVAASIALLLAISVVFLNQKPVSNSNQLAIEADTAQIDISGDIILPGLIAQNTKTNAPEKVENTEAKQTEDKIKAEKSKLAKAPKATDVKRQPAIIEAQPQLANKQPADTKKEASQGQPKIETQLALQENKEPAALKPATEKVIIEIRSGYQPEATTLAMVETETGTDEPKDRSKAVRLFKKLRNIKNGEEQVEIEELKDIKQTLLALVPKIERKSEN